MTTAIVYTGILGVCSLLTFILYAVDKRRAVKGEWRIPEATLLAFSFLGGAIGGYLAMYTVRHKIRRWYFHLFHIAGLAWQIGLLVFFIVTN